MSSSERRGCQYLLTDPKEAVLIPPFAETVHTAEELCSEYGEISQQCRKEHKAAVITVDGGEDAVLLSYEQYQQMKAHIELFEMLGEAEQDVEDRRIANAEECLSQLRTELLERNG